MKKQPSPQDERTRRPDAPRPTTKPNELDIESLDLTIEEVEERISPRETNVFDK